MTDVEFRRAPPDHLPFASWLRWAHIPDTEDYVVRRRIGETGDWDVAYPVTAPGSSERSTFGHVYLTVCGVDNWFKVAVAHDGTRIIPEVDRRFSEPISINLPCTAPGPRQLRARYSTKTSFSLSWNAVPDASAYKVERRRASSTYWESAHSGISEISGSPYTTTGLDCDTDYYFRVRARGDGYPYTLRFGEPSVEEGPEDTDDCGTNPPPPPPPPPGECQTDLGIFRTLEDFPDDFTCDFSQVGDYEIEFRLDVPLHVTAELLVPENTKEGVEYFLNRDSPIFSEDSTISEDSAGYLPSYLNLKDSDDDYAFRTVGVLEGKGLLAPTLYRLRVETTVRDTGRQGLVRLYGEEALPRKGHQADHAVQIVFDDSDPILSLRDTEPGPVINKAIDAATKEWNSHFTTEWPHIRFCEKTPSNFQHINIPPCVPGMFDDVYTVTIKTVSGDRESRGDSDPYNAFETDCGRTYACFVPVKTMPPPADEPHPFLKDLKDMVLIIEQPAWRSSPMRSSKDEDVRFVWTMDAEKDNKEVEGSEEIYRFAPGVLFHELGHLLGLEDLYLSEGELKIRGYDDRFKLSDFSDEHIMNKVTKQHELSPTDLAYVKQVYRNAHYSKPHVVVD